MIVHKISVDTYLSITDVDADGFTLDNEEGGQVWLSYEQLDQITQVLAPIREINGSDE